MARLWHGRVAAAAALAAGSLAAPAATRAQTAEETAALLWIGIEQGAEMHGEKAERVSTSPAIYHSVNPRTKEVSARVSVTKRSDCVYRIVIEPVKRLTDVFGDPIPKREVEVDFSRVTGLQPYANEPDLFMYEAERPICHDVVENEPCRDNVTNRPMHAPPTARARQVLAYFQQNFCKPSK